MPTAPYLIIAFDVAPGDARAEAIMKAVNDGFPITEKLVPLGVENLFLVELPESRALTLFSKVATHMMEVDRRYDGALRWTVQLCHTNEIGGA